MEEENIFENSFMKLERKNGVVYGTYKDVKIDLETAKEVVKQRLDFCNHQDVPMLITEAKFKGFDREARQFLSSDKGIEGINACAILVQTPFSSHMANFFMKIAVINPKIPTRVFSREDQALKWLKDIVKESPQKN